MPNEHDEQISFFPKPEPDPTTADNATTGKNKEPEVYDKDRVVAYAGRQHPITDRKLSLEEVRRMLERQYPELSKDRCEMTYNEKTGLIVPVVKGSRKGGR